MSRRWKLASEVKASNKRKAEENVWVGSHGGGCGLRAAAMRGRRSSVSNNIAEGFERGTTKELLTFLFIARGSAGEVRSMLCLFEAVFEFDPEFWALKSEISNLKSLAGSISRQLRGWAESLQESPITGQRYLTEKVRKTEQASTERDEFVKRLDRIRKGEEKAS